MTLTASLVANGGIPARDVSRIGLIAIVKVASPIGDVGVVVRHGEINNDGHEERQAGKFLMKVMRQGITKVVEPCRMLMDLSCSCQFQGW